MEEGDSPILIRCKFQRNSAERHGGAIVAGENSCPTLISCLFTGNKADFGGGIFNFGDGEAISYPLIINCTMSGNIAFTSGGGIYIDNSLPIIRNSILWDNFPEEIGLLGGFPDVTHSNIKGGWEGEFNINIDPNFVVFGYWDDNKTPDNLRDDVWIEGSYYLLPGSACIDSGNNVEVEELEYDIVGNDRIINGVVDIGAYETSVCDDILIYKLIVKAGKKHDDDTGSFTISGKFNANIDDFLTAEMISFRIGSWGEAIDSSAFRKGRKKYVYKYNAPVDGITSMTLDFYHGIFNMSGKKMNLTGTKSPVPVALIIGDNYFGYSLEYDEGENDVINGNKPIPIQLLSGSYDELRVDKVVCKPDKENNVKSLVLSGEIATADDIDLRTTSLIMHWGTIEHTVNIGEFELKGKSKYWYKKIPDEFDPANITISINLTKCTFQVVVKNTTWPWEDSPLTFGMEFGSFKESEEVTF